MQAEIVEDTRIVGPRLQRAAQRLDRGLRDGAASLQGQTFAQRRQRIGILRVLRETRAGLAQQAGHVELRRRGMLAGRTLGKRCGRQAGTADLEIKAQRQQRHEERKRRRQPLLPRLRCCQRPDARSGVTGHQHAALDLDAPGGGLGLGHRARRPLAFEFGQLIAIDRQLALEPVAPVETAAEQRPQQRADRRGGEQGEQEFQHVRQSFRSASRRRRSSSSSGFGAATGWARLRRAATRRAPPATSSSSGAPSHRTSVPALKGGFSST